MSDTVVGLPAASNEAGIAPCSSAPVPRARAPMSTKPVTTARMLRRMAGIGGSGEESGGEHRAVETAPRWRRRRRRARGERRVPPRLSGHRLWTHPPAPRIVDLPPPERPMRPARLLPSLPALAALAGPLGAQGAAAPAGIRGELDAQLADAERKLVALAEAMPQEKYGWRPAEGVRSVSEVFVHVAGANFMITGIAGVPRDTSVRITAETERTLTDKAAVMDLLRRSFAHARQAVAQVPD